ncbi:MAG: folate-binding protein [Gammaproteobacteria bacterium]|nr:folate-binding protein [Gammaproteobacteria bacterium]
MQSDWQLFLENRGAEFSDGIVEHYGNPAQELSVVLTGNIICDLSHYALLAINGEDAKDFLHTQFINDIDSLDESHSHLNGYCNPKGRLIANFRVFWREDTIYLRFPADLLDAVSKKLNMYKMRSKVNIEDHSDDMVRIGYSGKTADTRLAEILSRIPDAENEVVTIDNLSVIRIPGITPSYELYGDAGLITDIWTKLDVQDAPVGMPAWQLIEVLAGIPHVTLASTEQHVPQMLNYQAIDGLSFTKGCYPGQEIVARMHYLGKLKKRMYLARVQADEAPHVNQELVSSNTETGSRTGHLINVAAHPDGDYAVLAVIQISDAESEKIHLDSIDGPVLELQELPYPVELQYEK